MKKEILFATFLIGFTAMSAQIVLLRQMIVVFYGNEISLGLFLSAWLFWTALGSWLLGRFAGPDRRDGGEAAARRDLLHGGRFEEPPGRGRVRACRGTERNRDQGTRGVRFDPWCEHAPPAPA